MKGGSKGLIKKYALEDQIKGTDYENLDLLPADFDYRNLDLVLDKQKIGRVLFEFQQLQTVRSN